MPTYDYQCSTCGTNFELYQTFAEDALKKCPTKKSGLGPAACTSPGRGKVAKIFSAPGITFKGGGFYKTDSRSGSSATASASSSSASESSSDPSSSTRDAKGTSDKKSEPKTADKASDGGNKASDGGNKASTAASGSD